MSESVWIALFLLVAGIAVSLVSTLFSKLQDEMQALDAASRLRHEEVMLALQGYVGREPCRDKHLVLEKRLDEHASRLRKLEEKERDKENRDFRRRSSRG